MRKLKRILKKPNVHLCQCGCGQPVKKGNRFILGHNQKTAESSANAGRWKPGQSGNPKGSKTGSRNKTSLATENLFLDEQEALTCKCISLALNGNLPALKIAIDRICPVRRSVPTKIDGMPEIKKVEDTSKLTEFLLTAVAKGKLSIMDSEILSRITDKHIKALEMNQIVQRIEDLEEKLQ